VYLPSETQAPKGFFQLKAVVNIMVFIKWITENPNSSGYNAREVLTLSGIELCL
jgi:hypothetical protein